MALHFTDPETVALNRKGVLSAKQRRGLLMDCALLGAFAVAMAAVGVVLPFANGSWVMGAICVGVGVMILMSIKDTWALYRDPQPSITVKRGLVQPYGRIPINKGGTVTIGQEQMYLQREQIREIRFGYNYEIFVAMPYGKPISADAIDLA